MKFAVIAFAGKQFIIKPGDTLTVDGTWGEVDKEVTFEQVLLLSDKDLTIGEPTLSTKLTATVKAHKRGPKLDIRLYKAKSRQRRHIGYRSEQTVLEINDFAKKTATKTKAN